MLALVVCSLADYGVEIYHSRGKDNLMKVIVVAMMIPFAATMIPLFMVFAGWGMLAANGIIGAIK